MFILYFVILSVNVLFSSCQTSTTVINVVEMETTNDVTFVCLLTSADNLTRWTYLSGSTETSLMRFHNGVCTVSPSDSFLSDSSKYSYTCNSTVYQVTIHPSERVNWNNYIFACGDVIQPDGTESLWMIKIVQEGEQCNCNQTIKFNVKEVTEGDNVLFVCRVSSDVAYTNWNVNFGLHTAAMGVQNKQCTTTTGTTFLDNTREYIYTCNNTVYQVIRLNVLRSEHNGMYMCTSPSLTEGEGSNWIIKVKAPVTSVTMTPTNKVDVTENTAVEFTCITSTSRPAASVYWYIHPNGNSNNITQITENITTTADYNELSVITSTLHFVPTRQHINMKIYCTANNSINTTPVRSNECLLNVLYIADDQYIKQGNEYRVKENTSGTLSCTVKNGNPTSTLFWSCNNFSPTNQSTININGNITTTLTWTVLRNHEGTCTCTSQQAGFQNETLNVSLIVLYKAVVSSLLTNGSTNGVLIVDEGTTVRFKCVADGNPIPTISLNHGTNVLKSITSHQLEYTLSISCQDIGTYSCAAQNELNLYMNVTSADIIVYCSPRSSGTSDREILSGIGKKVKIACEVIAYPLPSFTWWHHDNDQWKMIQNTDYVSITSSGLQTILTLDKVDADDFTSYKVIVENSVGKMEQVYSLNDGSPETPTQLRYFEELSTYSSIKLAWNAGYNGGSPQIFYIKYKTTEESLWKYKTVNDDEEQTQIFTLSGLEEKMYYYVTILASNEYGNSTESPLLIANTKEIEKTQSSNTGPMVGGIVGGSILLAILFTIVGIIIERYVLHKGNSKKTSSSDKIAREIPNVSSPDIQFDNIGRENEYEMINQDNSSSMSYSTLQPDNHLTPDDKSGEKKEEYENLKIQAV